MRQLYLVLDLETLGSGPGGFEGFDILSKLQKSLLSPKMKLKFAIVTYASASSGRDEHELPCPTATAMTKRRGGRQKETKRIRLSYVRDMVLPRQLESLLGGALWSWMHALRTSFYSAHYMYIHQAC